MAATPQTGFLVLADLTGYTAYLSGSEIEHAPAIAGDLLETIVGRLEPPFRLVKLEGDAAFLFVEDGRADGSLLLDAIEASYLAFRRRLRSIDQATTCDCNSCRLAPRLDLKVFVHHGAYVWPRRRIAAARQHVRPRLCGAVAFGAKSARPSKPFSKPRRTRGHRSSSPTAIASRTATTWRTARFNRSWRSTRACGRSTASTHDGLPRESRRCISTMGLRNRWSPIHAQRVAVPGRRARQPRALQRVPPGRAGSGPAALRHHQQLAGITVPQLEVTTDDSVSHRRENGKLSNGWTSALITSG